MPTSTSGNRKGLLLLVRGMKGQCRPLLSAVTVALATTFAAGSAQAWTETALHRFCARPLCQDGYFPMSGVLMDSAGNFFGTTSQGGNNNGDNAGVIYELVANADRTAWDFQLVHKFCSVNGIHHCEDGEQPTGELIADDNGRLYGVTKYGGDVSQGMFYQVTAGRQHWHYQVLYAFCYSQSCQAGMVPTQGLTYAGEAAGMPWDGHAPLFGTTDEGGESSAGTIYELTRRHSQWTQQDLHSFDSSYKANGLVMDAAGNLYGVTTLGGAYGGGQIFELEHGSWNFSVLHEFCGAANCADGQYPVGRLTLDAHGHLFGVADSGGSANAGVVFEFAPDTQQYDVIYNFCTDPACNDGWFPQGGMILDSNGDLLGTTASGGDGYGAGGTAFRLHYDGNWTETVLHSFCSARPYCNDGNIPIAPLFLDGAGDIFGTTQYGGRRVQRGVVFELKP